MYSFFIQVLCIMFLACLISFTQTKSYFGVPPGSQLSTNFSKYRVAASFSISKKPCHWEVTYPDQSETATYMVYEQFDSSKYNCSNMSYNDVVITCIAEDSNEEQDANVTTELTLLQLLAKGNLRISLACGLITMFDDNVTVKDCNDQALAYNVTVLPPKETYNRTAHFGCLNDGDLFYSRGIRLNTNSTQCLANATWYGQENLQCWKAPTSVELVGNLSVKAGESVYLQCSFTDGFPSVNVTHIFIGNETLPCPKNQVCPTPEFQPSDNNKSVSCQAVSLYTNADPSRGKSMEYFLDVKYGPRNVVNSITTSALLIMMHGQYFLRSDENLSMVCSATSNPTAECTWSLCNSSTPCITIKSANNSCYFSGFVIPFSYVFCNANNSINKTSSTSQYFTVVQENRAVNVSISGASENANFSMGILTINLGETIELLCSIEHGNELSTQYRWKFPNNSEIGTAILPLKQLDATSTGNYTCISNDYFGNFSKQIFVDTVFAPYQEDFQKEKSLCQWEIGSNESCNVGFYANPLAEYQSLIKDNSLTMYDTRNLSVVDGQQVFVFKKDHVSDADFGTYKLNLKSSKFPDLTSIEFMILEKGNGSTENLDLGLIIGVSVASIILFILIVIVVIIILRQKKTKPEGQQVEVRPNAYADVQLQNQDGIGSAESQSGDHQMENNPLYNPGPVGNGRINAALQQGPEDPYSIADEPARRVNASEKVERVNVIYDGTALSGVVGTATPNKKEKKEELKESEEERQARLEGLYTFVDKKVKKNPTAGKKPKVKKGNADEDPNNPGTSGIGKTRVSPPTAPRKMKPVPDSYQKEPLNSSSSEPSTTALKPFAKGEPEEFDNSSSKVPPPTAPRRAKPASKGKPKT